MSGKCYIQLVNDDQGNPGAIYANKSSQDDGDTWGPGYKTWFHIAGVITCSGSDGDVKLYINGVEQGSPVTWTGDWDLANSTTFGAQIGSSQGLGTYLRGPMADVRIFNAALSAGTIATTLYSGNTGAPLNPATNVSGAYAPAVGNEIGWWKLNATASGTLDMTDSVASNDGAAVGNTKSAFVTVTGSGYKPTLGDASSASGDTTFTNIYVSGSTDALVPAGATFTTKGTVVLD